MDSFVTRPKNWATFQHYKNRRPPWIRLYHTLLDNPDFHALKGEDAKYLVMIWLIASEHENGDLPPLDEMSFRLRLSVNKTKQIVKRLEGWFEKDASNVPAQREQDAAPETEAETEAERETEAECVQARGVSPPKPNPTHAVPDSVDNRILCERVGIFNMREQADMQKLYEAECRAKGRDAEAVMEHMVSRWVEYQQIAPDLEWQYGSAYKFFMSGKWDDPRAWPSKKQDRDIYAEYLKQTG